MRAAADILDGEGGRSRRDPLDQSMSSGWTTRPSTSAFGTFLKASPGRRAWGPVI